jgi:hypothetical protein
MILQLEETLRSAEDPERIHAQARARATIMYFSSRMEVVSCYTHIRYPLGFLTISLTGRRRGVKAMTVLLFSCCRRSPVRSNN